MVATYNGWEDMPEDEREALEQWEAQDRVPGPSRGVVRRSGVTYGRRSGSWGLAHQ
jgi:hypothetical protein